MHTKRRITLALLIMAAPLMLNPVAGAAGDKPHESHGKGKDKDQPRAEYTRQASTPDRLSAGIAFSDGDRRTIVDYFHRQPMSGAALPPGIAKNYARGKPLPPGIAKRYLPDDLLHRLPARDGYEYAIVGRDVVLIELATLLVVDILVDALL